MSSGRRKSTGNDAKFFSSNRKGENHELREELRSPQRDRKRDAVKKVIANMTVGKDVSSLFMDVINCIQTDNLELKKLVYLYLINYAKTQPDQAILAVNTFVKDANDPNPLIRALAIRTMGCIRVEKITEYLCEPLSRCLKDDDPYVRKTAAVCTAKLFDISPDLVEERGFLDTLRDLISDPNPTVVANAVAALSEISETSGKDVLEMTSAVLQKLLAALNECTEWGQIFILDSLSNYVPQDAKEAEGIIERVSPRLQHSNSAVVMSAVKIILRYMEEITNPDTLRTLHKKLAPPLVTLLNSEPEIQYVALRNINLIVLKRPKILEHEIKVFFCKYNDPIYVKMEKLEIIIRLASEKNIEQVLLELKEYSTEVDVEFVRKSVRAIGRCAIKLERSTERCINVLLDLIQTKVNYVVQEAIVVIKDIFRKYPNKYESIIANLCENLEELDEPEAKAAMVWIIGEYAERIENADDLLESFLESFQDETAQVQLQLLTATVKLFLKQPDTSQEIIKRVLNLATEESDNPDLRDRGYFYWRLLSSDPEAARVVVLSEKPEIGEDNGGIDPILLDELIGQIATLASVYHKPPEAFVMKSLQLTPLQEDDLDEDGNAPENDDVIDVSGGQYAGGSTSSTNGSSSNVGAASNSGNLLDLLDDSPSTPVTSPGKTSSSLPSLVTSDAGHGLFINGTVVKAYGKVSLELDIGNTTSTPVQNLAIQLNKNAFAVTPQSPQIVLPQPIANGSIQHASVPLATNPNFLNPSELTLNLQAAMKNQHTNAVFYFLIPNTLDTLFIPSAPLEIGSLVSTWKSIDDSLEVSALVNDLPNADPEHIKSKLQAKDIAFVATREIPGQAGQSAVFFSAQTINSYSFLIELKFKTGMNICKVTVKSQNKAFSELCKNAVAKIIV